jgi:ATP/maltotriose-dependent transcriptional regulator MalT
MSTLPPFPLIGRTSELNILHGELDAAGAANGGVVFLAGDGGVGKTRLAATVLLEAKQLGWSVALGRAFAAESGVPYSLFADAFLPVLHAMPEELRTVITRGVEAELAELFPSLAAYAEPMAARSGMPLPDLKNRLLWNFTKVLKALAARAPTLVVLEDLQWADASSLEMLHFVARQTADDRLLIVCTYNSDLRDDNPALVAAERSLLSLGHARVIALRPIAFNETAELLERMFDVSSAVTANFAALLYGWTRGNPFFITEILQALIAGERVHKVGDRWIGWDVEQLDLPPSIRDAIMLRAARLSNHARTIVELMAVHGRQISFELLAAHAALRERDLVEALKELTRAHFVEERTHGSAIWYDFSHPLTREAFYTRLGDTGAAVQHARLATLLEDHYGPDAELHADELAFHFGRSHLAAHRQRAVQYVIAAGRRALDTYSNKEAEAYLTRALEHGQGEARAAIIEDLARAKQRLGKYAEAIELWGEALAGAASRGDASRVAAIERRMGLACFWSGNADAALAHYELGLRATVEAHDLTQEIQLRIARAMCLQELGRFEEGLPDAFAALAAAEALGDRKAIARAHRALLLLHCWTGPADVARAHGRQAIELLSEAQDRTLAWSCHWAMAVLEGLTGNAAGLLKHLDASNRLAEELRSPLLQLWCNELAIEYAYGSGEWDRAIELGEQSISLARAFNQKMLLPRLLVWTGMMYLGRDDTVRAKSYFDEAWQISGADGRGRGHNVHSIVPAHIGMAAYHAATGDYAQAIAVGEAGLAIADRSGYVVWAVHRLMPTIAESYAYLHDVDGAQRVGRRLREESQRLDHKLGLAWADTCDAITAWLSGDPHTGAALMVRAAEQLERVPYVLDAARVRRQLAGRLAEMGEREQAVAELRRVHDILLRLGAERELRKTREMFRELGARLPPRAVKVGAGRLTERELEIARLAAAGKSNKAIGKSLDISTRTVGTHLSNIFKKLCVESREQLLTRMREQQVFTRN